MTPDPRCPACGVPSPASGLLRCPTCGEPLPSPLPPSPPPRSRPSPRRRRFRLRTLVVAGGVAVILGVVAALTLAGPHWRNHEDDGGFRVDLPAAPDPRLEKAFGKMQPIPGGGNVCVVGTRLRLSGQEYSILFADIPSPGHRLPDENILQAVVADVPKIPGNWKLKQQKAVTVSGFPGRELEVESPGKAGGVMRVVVAHTRFFILIAGGPAGTPADHPDLRRFLDSFEITHRPLLAARDHRDAFARQLKIDAEAEKVKKAEREVEQRKAAEVAAVVEREKTVAFLASAPYRGRPVPDPAELGGVRVHLPCDAADAYTGLAGATTGPGVKGAALYVPSLGDTATRGVWAQDDALYDPYAQVGPLTLAGWVRARGAAHVEVARLGNRPYHNVAIAVGIDGNSAWARLETHRVVVGEPGKISAPRPTGEDWHHVAATIEPWGDRRRLRLYLDGRRVAVEDFDFVPRFPARTEPTGVTAAFAHLHPPSNVVGTPVAAVDEVCAFARALTPAEIHRLAAADGTPPPPEPVVTLTAGPELGPLRDAVFDARRKVVWAVTPAGVRDNPSELVRYTYPDFRPDGRWPLDGNAGGTGVAFDADANRLFLPVGPLEGAREKRRTDRPGAVPGKLVRIDLDDLPAKREPVVAAKVLAPADGGWFEFGPLTLSADGRWVYFQDLRHGGWFCRVESDLLAAPDVLQVPATAAGRLYPGAKARGLYLSVPGSEYLYELDLAGWAVRGNTPSAVPRSAILYRHPDGRSVLKLGDYSSRYLGEAGPKETKAVQWPTALPAVFAEATADRRLLFVSAGGSSGLAAFRAAPGADRMELGRLSGVGGPFWVSPDGACLLFRSGQVVRVGPLPGP